MLLAGIGMRCDDDDVKRWMMMLMMMRAIKNCFVKLLNKYIYYVFCI